MNNIMKNQEKFFFVLCYDMRKYCVPYDFINSKIVKEIPRKQLKYYLTKWTDLGFYDYGVNLFFGWFYPDKLPERYKDVLAEYDIKI